MFAFSRTSRPTLPSLDLTRDEQQLISELLSTGKVATKESELCKMFYLGEQIITNLRIAVPKELEPHLKAIAGWPSVAVDPLVERLGVDGFRTPDGDDVDAHLSDLMVESGLAVELPLAFTDALSMGSAYISVGSPVESGAAPVVTVDSPLGTYVKWDSRGVNARVALQTYAEGSEKRATLLKPRLSLHLVQNNRGQWVLDRRDEHGFDFVPLTRMINMPLSGARLGRSEITPAIRSHTISASRALRALDVAGEIYSVPQRLILGATEEAFQRADGSPKTALETYITSMLALERDGNGELPDVKQMSVYDPSVFTKVIDMHAAQVAGLLAAVPQDLGIYTEGNPPSSEGQRASEARRDRKARVRQKFLTPAVSRVMQHVLRFENGGQVPDEYRRITPDWELDSTTLSADDVSKIGEHIPAGSDVVLKKLGFNAIERRQMAADARRARVSAAASAVAARMTQEAQGAGLDES